MHGNKRTPSPANKSPFLHQNSLHCDHYCKFVIIFRSRLSCDRIVSNFTANLPVDKIFDSITMKGIGDNFRVTYMDSYQCKY